MLCVCLLIDKRRTSVALSFLLSVNYSSYVHVSEWKLVSLVMEETLIYFPRISWIYRCFSSILLILGQNIVALTYPC